MIYSHPSWVKGCTKGWFVKCTVIACPSQLTATRCNFPIPVLFLLTEGKSRLSPASLTAALHFVPAKAAELLDGPEPCSRGTRSGVPQVAGFWATGHHWWAHAGSHFTPHQDPRHTTCFFSLFFIHSRFTSDLSETENILPILNLILAGGN